MELRSRFVNAQVAEMMARLGMHSWRLSDDERFFMHRYLYLSVLETFRTLGIPYTEQDKVLPTENAMPLQVPEFMRIPAIPPPGEDNTEALQIPIQETNGHGRDV